MGQKVNPHGLRVGVIKDWDSRWYARDDKVGDLIVEDYNIRKYLKKLLYAAGVPKIEIERDSAKVKVFIHCSRPGLVIGKGGADIEKLRLDLEKKFGKPVALSIIEVKNPDTDAQLVAENIASQLEKRVAFRRTMKSAMQRAMRLGVRGIKIKISVSAALRSPATSRIMRAPSPCRPSVPTSTTVSPRLPPPTAASALRSGSTRARSSIRLSAPPPAPWTPPVLRARSARDATATAVASAARAVSIATTTSARRTVLRELPALPALTVPEKEAQSNASA